MSADMAVCIDSNRSSVRQYLCLYSADSLHQHASSIAPGVVSDAGTCCAMNTTAGASVTLDRAGQCCSQGLDACGVCGGNGLTIDFTGTCCNGALDASGLCCALPHVVDDFGVCAGNSSTGVIVLDLTVLSSNVTGELVGHGLHL
jgi:hypothetical protein